jgi:hypothetical protein
MCTVRINCASYFALVLQIKSKSDISIKQLRNKESFIASFFYLTIDPNLFGIKGFVVVCCCLLLFVTIEVNKLMLKLKLARNFLLLSLRLEIPKSFPA